MMWLRKRIELIPKITLKSIAILADMTYNSLEVWNGKRQI